MSTASINLADVSGFWRTHRTLYPAYIGVVRQFNIDLAASRDLEAPINRSEEDVLERVRSWFDLADEKIEVWQLRQFLQTSTLCTEEVLRIFARRQLSRPDRNAKVRDKLDYLLVQYFAQCAPHDAHNTQITLEHVSDILHPVLGFVNVKEPPLYQILQKILVNVETCNSLHDLLQRRILEQARKSKEDSGGDYFEPISLIIFTRFNFLMRLGFFRLMHADLHAVRHTLHDLETLHVKVADCTAAGLAAEEPLISVRQICHEWKKPFRAAYSAGNNFRQLVDLRVALDSALHKAKSQPPAPPPVAVSILAQPPAPPLGTPSAMSAIKSTAAAVGAKAAPAITAPAPSTQNPAPVTQASDVAAVTKSSQPSVTHEKVAPLTSGEALQDCVEQIAEILLAAPAKGASVTNVLISGSKQLLASWEVSAFTKGGDELSDILQRSVAARVLLSIATDITAQNLAEVLLLAQQQAVEIQAGVAQAKQAKNIDAAVNLAATAKRLLGSIEAAQKTG